MAHCRAGPGESLFSEALWAGWLQTLALPPPPWCRAPHILQDVLEGSDLPSFSCTDQSSSLCFMPLPSESCFNTYYLFLLKMTLKECSLLSKRPVLWLTFLGMATWPVSTGLRSTQRFNFPPEMNDASLHLASPILHLRKQEFRLGFFVCLFERAPLPLHFIKKESEIHGG